MCTLSYIPLGTNAYILTSNRDERKARPTLPPLEEQIGGKAVFFPKDEEAGGTWIAAGENGTVCCLLNGAFESHERKSHYAQSRGKVLLETFENRDVLAYFSEKDLTEIEPFTLIAVEMKSAIKLHELRWDGENKHLKALDPTQAYIWSSAALYSKEIRTLREQWFEQGLKNDSFTDAESILKFHVSNHGNDIENDLVMKRGDVLKTVSITQIKMDEGGFSMDYHDLLKNEKSRLKKQIKRSEF
ncbi:MAG: hypothetical protein ACI8ZO_001086 [Flavobacteriales bacterium]|jgi:uncharacterized protein with NRDE domain